MALSDGTAYLYIYPRTLTNCVVTSSFTGGVTGTSTPTDNGTCLYTSVGLLLSSNGHTEITITADGCLPQTLGSDGELSDGDYTITMEPAAGYKKLYAWKLSSSGKGGINNPPNYVYTKDYPITNTSAIYDVEGNLIDSDGASASGGTDGSNNIYAYSLSWDVSVSSGGSN